jgi:hypothetical protein
MVMDACLTSTKYCIKTVNNKSSTGICNMQGGVNKYLKCKIIQRDKLKTLKSSKELQWEMEDTMICGNKLIASY